MEKFKGKGTIKISLDNDSTHIHYHLGADEGRSEGYEDDHVLLWHDINSYFRKRGFKVIAAPEVHKRIRKDYRVGSKNKLEFHSNCYPNGFEYDFFQNVVFENKSGGRYDFDKYKRMPYMIKLAYRNEMIRLADFCKLIGVNVVIKKKLTDIEAVIHSKNSSCHTIGKIESLADFEAEMKDYDRNHNSFDKNKVIIKNGDTKCFYDYHGKLQMGQCYFSLNMRWWIIVNGTSYQTSSWDLFDYYSGVPMKRVLSDQEKTQRLHSELKKSEEIQDYERCIELKKLLSNKKLFYVRSLKNSSWYAPASAGYTSDKSRAGVFTEETINANPGYYNNNETTKAIPVLR